MKNKDNLFRAFDCRTRAVEGAERTVELSFSSETPYTRWFGPEILSHDEGAIDLSRLQEIGVLLFNHNSDVPIGAVEDVWLDKEERRCKARVRFDVDAESDRIYQKVATGSLKGVSVGYRVDNWEEVEEGAKSLDGRFTGPCSIAVRWMPFEISIVSVPADASVGVGRSADESLPSEPADASVADSRTDNIFIKGDAENMAEKETPMIDTEAIATGAIEKERQRAAEITAMSRTYDFDATDFLARGASVEEVRKFALEKLAAERRAVPVSVVTDEADKFRRAAIDGLAMRAGIQVEKPADGADEFRGKRMLRLAAECIERDGKSARNMSDEMLVREALTGTGAFPGILSNVANKSMAQSYQTAPTTYQLWCGKGANSDFKQATRYRLSEADELVKLNEGGEFTNAEFTEASVTTAVATYGRSFGITRQAIINDDLGALSAIPARMGAAARRMIDNMVYKILTDNPTIEGAALFHNNHKNLGSGAIAVASLGAAKAAMAKQKNIGGKESLNIQPAFLIVPADLEVTAAQLIGSVVDPSKNNAAINPFANKLTVVSTPILSEASDKVWYLAAAPGYCPTIEVTTLNGKDAPTLESAVQFDTLGIKYRIYMDVGVNLLDFRGLYKSTGV